MKIAFLKCVKRGSVASILALGLAAIVPARAENTISSNAAVQIQSLMAEKASRTPAQQKMDSQLIYAARLANGQPVAPGVTLQQIGAEIDGQGRVLVDMDATVSQALLDAITQAGGQVVNSYARFHAIRARIPTTSVEAIAGRVDVKFIRPAVKAITNTGSLDSEGDKTHRADSARASFGVDGSGVKVGVLSDSVDFLANSQATGDLPAVTILPGQSGVPGSGEGTAMLEIIHDVAPGAQLYFASGFNGAASFAQNIIDLRTAGCDVIVDDIGYFNESPFQDAIIAQAVNQVTADGALYFSSAANSGSLKYGTSGTWQGDFVDGGAVAAPVTGKGGVYHSFGASTFNTILQRGFAATLFWADPLGASTNDYDLYVLDSSGQNIVFSSTTTQNGSQDPYEIAGMSASGQRIVVVKASGDARFLHIDTIRGRLAIATDGNTKGHAVAVDAFGVAASDASIPFPNPFDSSSQVESFSSDGPRRVFYVADGTPITPGNFLATGGAVRNKPDITAADGVATTVPGFDPFYGTSAAAPHAAAIAALLLSYNPDLTPGDVRNAFTNTAIDIEGAGYDVNAGFGVIMADNILSAAPPPNPTPKILVLTNFVSGGNGNGMIDPNECNDIYVTVTNSSSVAATSVRLTLGSLTPNVFVTTPTVNISVVPAASVVSNVGPFRVTTIPEFICGTKVDFSVAAKSDQGINTNQFSMDTGTLGSPVRFDNLSAVVIPDLSEAVSTINVTNINGALGKVSVALYLTHTFDSDLTLELISPDGVTNTLAANVGGSGDNFGTSCSPDSFRTTFDDDAAVSISAGGPPFAGAYRPQFPLSVFNTKSGTNVNGAWKLRVADTVGIDSGVLQCWSLFLTPSQCTDGGGSCPGTDLAIALTDSPDPVVTGSNLVYTLTVTNLGPNTAKGTVLTHNLPGSVVFVSATTTRGSVSHTGGVITANLGNMPYGSTATITVTVVPGSVGTITSSATVFSTEPETFPPNNAVTTTTLVQSPSADLSISLSGAPNPAIVGGNLSFTATVLNSGPSTATGVVVTNTLPSSVAIISASSSQGSVTINGNVVVCLVGTMTNGATATATINTVPLTQGTVFANAKVVGNLVDPVLANNSATAAIGVGQASDLAITIDDQPDPVVVNSNFTYTVTVTNRGPNPATSVVVNQSLATSLTVVNSSVSQGSLVVGGGSVVWSVGGVPVNGVATLTLVAKSASTGTVNTTASVNGSQADPNLGDNTANASTLVATPFVSIVAAGARLTSESAVPANGAIDPTETVTLDLRLRNAGNIPNTNVVATLLATGGVTSPSGAQTYGVLPPGGLPVAKSFTFTASGTNGGAITATLQISDGGNALSNVTFTFSMPRVYNFTNTAAITIPSVGSASPYPSTIVVSGVTGTVGQVTATLNNLNHTYAPDVDVLLVGPLGQKVVLMGSAGNPSGVSSANITFTDSASQPIPQNGQISTGSFQPANYNPTPAFAAPAPGTPYATSLSAFANLVPNGTWSLYITDKTAGDSGNVAAGWSLGVSVITPVNSIADLGVAGSVTSGTGLVGDSTTWTVIVTNSGPNSANGVVVTNTLSAGLALQSVTSSQGITAVNGNSVIASLGSFGTNSTASITIVAKPTTAGSASVTATVATSDIDLNSANNTAVISTSNSLPLADIGIGFSGDTIPAITGSNLTFTLSVTNAGPGKSLGTVVAVSLAPGATYQSAALSKGSHTYGSGTVICSFGDLIANETVTATIIVVPQFVELLTNYVSAFTQSTDTNPANNYLVYTIPATNPHPTILAAGAAMISEAIPANGAVDTGETVTVALSLANSGQVPTANLTATLLATGGVGSPSGPQNYGVVTPGGPAVARDFTFTAPNTPVGTVTATLQLNDNGSPLGSVNFVFGLPNSTSFASSTPITIPSQGAASPYPSIINVSGVTGVVGKVTVTLTGLTHSFPADVDALVVGPQGQKILVMSDAGGGYSVSNLNLTFSDSAATGLPAAAALTSGTFKPTDHESGDVLPFPAPSGEPGTQLSTFNGTDPNGNWALYVSDDSTGDAGLIAGGWSLSFTTIQPVSPVANVGVVAGVSSPETVTVGEPVQHTIVVTNRGPSDASSVVVSETLPLGASLSSATASQGTFSTGPGVVVFNLGNLAVGAGAQLTVTLYPTIAGNNVNSIAITCSQTDLDASDNFASISTVVASSTPATLEGAYDFNNQLFEVNLTGQPEATYILQRSDDLQSWSPVATNTASAGGVIKFTDSASPAITQRYYRAQQLIP